jgi:hypothetical protein
VLAEYLAEGPYKFSMAFGRGRFEDFWGATAENEQIRAERKKWLRQDPAKYFAALPEAADLLNEADDLGRAHGTLPPSIPPSKSSIPDYRSAGLRLGESWEPDWLILKKEAGVARLLAGCVCFPSSWSLEEKIGRPIEEIHGVVPELNANLGKQIGTFLERIKPGVSWTRNNWGLSRSPEWNQHPERRTPRLDSTVKLGEVFFRVEEQSLVALPRTEGILFGIRLKVFSLAGYEGTQAGMKLAEALDTMPEPMAQYKGLAAARVSIARLLRGR